MDLGVRDRDCIGYRDAVGIRIFLVTTNSTSEKRLDELREQAWKNGVVADDGVDIAGGPIPREPGYYGQAVLKAPVWTWEIPVYFFVGGFSGTAAVIALAALIFGKVDLGRGSMLLATVGAILSPILLTMDLGRPHLFLNMLRVFKYKSPMSVGAWIVSIFGAFTVPGFLALELHVRHVFGGNIDHLLRTLAAVFILGSAFWGVLLSTYTGVLLGVTAIPAWFLHRVLLPIHFGTAGLGSAVVLLELLGHRIAPLNALGFLAAASETALWVWLEVNRHGAADRALHAGYSGWLVRCGEILSGPMALLLRSLGLIPFAGISFLLGAFVSRFGWIESGKVCACDVEAVFASQS